MINLHNKSLADAANTEKRVFRKLSVEEAHLANALADKTKQYGFKHWDEYYPTLEIFELDAAAGELFGCFVDEKLVSIITVSFSKEEIEDVLAVSTGIWSKADKPSMLSRLCVDPDYRRMGIATFMMRQAAIQAGQMGADMLWLLVATDNADAIGIYISLGYTKVGSVHIWDNDFYCYELSI